MENGTDNVLDPAGKNERPLPKLPAHAPGAKGKDPNPIAAGGWEVEGGDSAQPTKQNQN